MYRDNVLDHKVGDSFQYDGKALGTDDYPIDITNYTIKAQVRDGNRLVSESLVTKPYPLQGEYRINIQDTKLWPVKRLSFDVQFIDPSGLVESTETIEINAIKDVTA